MGRLDDRVAFITGEQMRAMTQAMIAIGRPGRPEDLANVHLFLCSAEADFVSGVVIPVTGASLGS